MNRNFAVQDIVKGLSGNKLRTAITEAAKEAAQAYHAQLIANIRGNKYGFQLAASTIRKRLAAGADLTPLVFTEDYIGSIIVTGTVVRVKKGTHYSGLTYAELSFILEYGRRDAGIPAFPVWSRTYEDFQPEYKEILHRHVSEALLPKTKRRRQ
jgi:hypothetical protein